MNIREDSKKIVKYFLEKAIECGDLDLGFAHTFSYNSLAEALALGNGKYCRVCCQYLREHGCITTHAKGESNDIFGQQRTVRLSGLAVDFLETP